jgi:hypothetical protein
MVNIKIPRTLTLEEADRILQSQIPYRYDREWNIAICAQCQYAIRGTTLAIHARVCQKKYIKEYESCVLALQTKNVRKTLTDFPRPPNGIPPIAGLKIDDGFGCTLCNYLTKSKSLIKEHGIKHPGIKDYHREVKLQVSINLCFIPH